MDLRLGVAFPLHHLPCAAAAMQQGASPVTFKIVAEDSFVCDKDRYGVDGCGRNRPLSQVRGRDVEVQLHATWFLDIECTIRTQTYKQLV